MSTAQRHVHRFLQPLRQPARHHRGAGAGAAGQGLAGPALVHPQAYVAGIQYLHVAGVHAPWKAAVMLD